MSSLDSSPFIIEETSPQKRESERSNFPADSAIEADTVHALDQLQCTNNYYSAALVGDDFDIAFDQISCSAKQGNMEAQFTLGNLYALGHGTSKSPSHAYTWYTRAAVQGYKKALIRIHNLYQEDIKMHCRGQLKFEEEKRADGGFKKKIQIRELNKYRLEEEKWADDDFKKETKIRELNEYRLEQQKTILNGAISYYTKQFKIYQSSNQEDPNIQMNLAFLYQHGYGVKKCTRWAFEYYQMAAERGSTEAQYNLGDLYRKHTKMKFNYRHAFKWLTKSAQGGNRIAQRCLAYFYLKGLATDMDYGVALSWYTKAAEAGDSEAMVTLGKLYRKGDYNKQDLQMAVHWYTLAARQGNIVAQNCLSQLHQRAMLDNMQLEEDMLEYLTESSMNSRLCTRLSLDICKRGDSPNFKQLNELAKRALIGDGQAMYQIGRKYLKGDNDFIQDKDAGRKWIKNAANAKHKDAQLLIAEMYKKGGSVEQDYHKAAIWYKTLAKQKDTVAQYNVGVMYNEGLGVRKDPLEASKWFIWAADQSDSGAQYNLARLRTQGRGVRQDEQEAVELYHQSAKQRHVLSCCNLGKIYLEGQYELDKNEIRGLKLMEFAAKNGSIQAQLEMARLVREGEGILQCRQSEIEYLTMAVHAGSIVAHYQLAVKYLKGSDVDQDYVKAYTLFKQANNQKILDFRSLVQSLNTHGIKIVDYFRILKMFIEVTEKGIENLQYNLGRLYEYGINDRDLRNFPSNKSAARKWYKAASEIGDFRADYKLGLIYEYGSGIKKNLNEAIKYYRKASVKGDADASFRLAGMYLEGYGVTQDLLKAFGEYNKAFIMGNILANDALVILEDGNLDDDNDNTCYPNYFYNKGPRILGIGRVTEQVNITMLEKTTEEGYTQLQYQLGVWYAYRKDYSNALKWFSHAADIGVTDAYYRRGVFYEEGRGIDQDYSMAAKMYQRATEKEHENACYRLGLLYQYGKGVKLNYLKAYQFYKMAKDMGHVEAYKVLNITLEPNVGSNNNVRQNPLDPSSQKYQDSLLMCKYVAEQGDTDIQFKVGFACEYCIPELNYAEAYKWYSLAAKGPHKEAIYHLGLLHEKGLGTSQDYQKSIQLYEQASRLGSDSALYRLGHIYHHGNGAGIDPEKAFEYYTLSAKIGNPEYQCLLGKLYEKGELVQKNLIEALQWYTKAYVQGYDNISRQLNDMYNDKPYEDFFYERLIRNLSIASRGDFRLRKEYNHFDYGSLNYKLGILYAFGYGADQDLKKAGEYFLKKYTDYSFKAEYIVSLWFDLGSIKARYILEALGEDEEFLDQLDGEQLFVLGTLFFHGLEQGMEKKITRYYNDGYDSSQKFVIEKDYSKAFKLLKKAVEKNNSKAILLLGTVYHSCCSVNQCSEQDEIHLQSVANDNIRDMERIVSLHRKSKEIQSYSLALALYRSIDKLDFEEFSRYSRREMKSRIKSGLGLLYEHGDGVKQDYKKAMKCYQVSTDDPVGLHRMGLMHYYGKGVSVNYNIAFRLFERATADRLTGLKIPYVSTQYNTHGGDSQTTAVYRLMDLSEIKGESHYYLGLMYKYGQGVPQYEEWFQYEKGYQDQEMFQDQEKSQHHFRCALSCGCKRAKNEIID